MDKSLRQKGHAALVALLRDLRLEAGMTQAQVAARVKEPQSFVSKYESGERRLDVLEVREVCLALGTNLTYFVRELEDRLK